MAQFVENPRRALRAPARCRTAVAAPSGPFESETEDIGARGCQLVAPRPIRRGEAVELTVTDALVREPLRIAGRVAWVSPQAPWRVGIAFAEERLRDSTRWFEKLVAAAPGLAGFRRVPERIPLDATVYLAAPPRFLLDFTPDEALLLRTIASGARVDELEARLRDRWPGVQRALFSLIARQAVTLVRGQAVHPEAWRKILTEVEASLAVESLGRREPLPAPPEAARRAATPPPTGAAAPAPPPPAAAPSRAPETPPPTAAADPAPFDPTRVVDLPEGEEPPLELARPKGDDLVPQRPRAPGRGAEAQGAYDRARAEIAAGNTAVALGLLRRALQLCPGDPEIGEALGKLAFERMDPGAR